MGTRTRLASLAAATLLAFGFSAPSAEAELKKVRFAANWVAQAEHGGFYQAVAEGRYEACGLEVEIIPGGPQVNNRLLLPTGRIDFLMGANMLQAFASVQQGIPTTVVAAMFQKEPLVLMSHPGQGFDTLESLKDATLLIGAEGFNSYYQWLITDFGFTADNVRNYTFNPAPFIANKDFAQQGYLTSEPFAIEREGGFKPNVFLLADHGFDSYSTTIEVRNDFIEEHPKAVQCFIDASAEGWVTYLYGDNAAANALIKTDNPEMTDEQIAFSIAQMKEYGIVISGDATTSGVGAMTTERQKSFFDTMVKAGVLEADVDFEAAFTTQFVNKGVSVDLMKEFGVE